MFASLYCVFISLCSTQKARVYCSVLSHTHSFIASMKSEKAQGKTHLQRGCDKYNYTNHILFLTATYNSWALCCSVILFLMTELYSVFSHEDCSSRYSRSICMQILKQSKHLWDMNTDLWGIVIG